MKKNQLELSFSIFADCPSARNFIELQKAMIAYQEQRNQRREEYERDNYLRGKVNYDRHDSDDYVCEGFPGRKCEYRCTVNAVYDNPNCRGHIELDARDGYYITAHSPQEALEEMRSRYPDFASEGFTVEIWKVLD